MSKEKMRSLFIDAARALGLADGARLDDDCACTIRSNTPGMPAIHLSYDEGSDILDVFAEIGCVPDGRESLYREFLFDNLFLKGTKGAVFAASPQTGCVVLQREIDIGPVEDPSVLAEAVADFAEVTLEARRRLCAAVAEPFGDELAPENGLRV